VAFVAFDVLSFDGESTDKLPLFERRELLVQVVDQGSSIAPITVVSDPTRAGDWLRTSQRGVEGVMAKTLSEPYLSGRRLWVKVKRRHTAEVVVGGCRHGNRLLLGTYGVDGYFSHVGETLPLKPTELSQVQGHLVPYRLRVWTGRPPGLGRWNGNHYDDWIDCQPTVVVEVTYTQLEGGRFRYPVRFLRLRLDRDPKSCGSIDSQGIEKSNVASVS
jgi:ATP-dependent DNA ligase